MSSDPRSKVDIPLRYGSNLNLGKTTLDRLDAVDPLRLALREPSDELIGTIISTVWNRGSRAGNRVLVRAVLAALAEAVTPDGE
jgi:hypothetical protein